MTKDITHQAKSSSFKIDTSINKRVLASCMVGTALEWYDFVIYGYFAAVLGKLFFPTNDPLTQILASWGVFWVGFIARPLGSVFFGHLGDKVSRKFALTLSIYAMAIPSTLMGCLPTYEQIGVTASVLLVILRTFQGFAIGGEFTGSMIFLVEYAPEKKRGLWGSWACFSSVLGVISGSGVVALLSAYLSETSMQAWGWRMAFLISVIGSLVGGYIRRRLADPQVYLEAKNKRKNLSAPLKDLLKSFKSKMVLIIFVDVLTAVGFFIVAIFLATYFRTTLHYPAHLALMVNTISMIVFAAFCLIGGYLSDILGRKKILAYACIGFIIFSYLAFSFMHMNNGLYLVVGQIILAICLGLFYGTIPATLTEIMPTEVRFSGLSISHNLSMAIFGGGAPLIATHLIHDLNDISAPAYLLMGAAMISLIATLSIKKLSYD